MEFKSIKTTEDVTAFLDETNGLHDGELLTVEYKNNGIIKIGGGHSFEWEKTSLTLKVLVTSICDTVVEIEFNTLYEWQIRYDQTEITHTSVIFNDDGRVLWLDDYYIDSGHLKNHSYVVAESMKWRITEDNRPLRMT